jgi:hypothetical protein
MIRVTLNTALRRAFGHRIGDGWIECGSGNTTHPVVAEGIGAHGNNAPMQ